MPKYKRPCGIFRAPKVAGYSMRPSVRRLLWLGSQVLIAACVAPAILRAQEPVQVKIVALNDFHGYLTPPLGFELNIEPEGGGRRIEVQVGGASALATTVKRLQAKSPHSIFVGVGDLIGGSPAISAWTLDEATIDVMNQMGLELSTIGNHEFDRGKAELKRIQNGGCAPASALRTKTEVSCSKGGSFSGAKFQYLGANAIDQDTQKPIFAPVAMREFAGVKVGFVGVSLLNTPGTTRGAGGITFLPEAETVNQYARELRAQGADAIVALIHEGGSTSARKLNDRTCPDLTGDIVPVVQGLSRDVDVVLSAHTHKEYICTINGILVTQAGYYGNMVAEVDLTIVKGKGVVSKSARSVPVIRAAQDPLPPGYEVATPDPLIENTIAFYDRLTEPERKKVFGYIAQDIDRIQTETGTRIDVADHPLGRVIADAFLDVEVSGRVVDIGMINPGGLRATVRYGQSGELTYDDVFAVAPFNNDLIYVQLTGAQLLRLLEQQWEEPNCRAKQYRGMCGRILQVSSTLKYKWIFDPKQQGRPNGKGRVIVPGSVTIKGKKLDPQKSYGIVTQNFLAEDGGDNFSIFKKGQKHTNTLTSDLNAIMAKMQKTTKEEPLRVPPARVTCIGCLPIP